MRVETQCKACGKTFLGKVFPSRPVSKYCSRACANAGHSTSMTVTKICPTCGVSFTAVDYVYRQAKDYCSQQCWLKKHNNPERNAEAGRMGRHKIRAAQVDTGKGVSYRKFYGRHEHRVVAEKIIGRALLPNEVVHHIDGDRRNNSPENLRVMDREEHTRLHSTGKSRRKSA
jgi:hypothetical protein